MRQTIVGERPVIDRASELGRALGASSAFRDYEQALEQYQSDPSAAELLEKVRQVQQEASAQEMPWGESGDWTERLASQQQQVRAHPVIRALQQTETELAALLFGTVLKLGEMTGIDYAEACTGRSLSGCGPTGVPEHAGAVLADAPEIRKAVEELGDLIRDTPAYQLYAESRRAFSEDSNLKRLRKEIRDSRETYLRAQGEGRVTLDLIERVRTAQSRLQEHPSVVAFSQKRRDMYRVMQEINRAIGDVVGIDIAQVVAPRAGCCG